MTTFFYDPKNVNHCGPETGNLPDRLEDGGLTFAIISSDTGYTFVTFQILGYVPLTADGIAAAEEISRRFKAETAFREELAEYGFMLGCNYRESSVWPECRPLPNMELIKLAVACGVDPVKQSRPPNAPS